MPPTLTPFAQRASSLPVVFASPAMFWTAVLTLLFAALSWWPVRGYPPDAPLHHDILSPILALELPHSAQDFAITLEPPGSAAQPIRAAFERSLEFDFALIVSCACFLFVSWRVLFLRRPASIAVLIAFAALCDLLENLRLLAALHTPLTALTDAQAGGIRLVSTLKWAALSALALCFAAGLTKIEWRPLRRPGTGLLAIELMLAALLGFTGLNSELPGTSWQPGWFSHRHLETFVVLFSALPLFAIASGAAAALPFRRRPPAQTAAAGI